MMALTITELIRALEDTLCMLNHRYMSTDAQVTKLRLRRNIGQDQEVEYREKSPALYAEKGKLGNESWEIGKAIDILKALEN